MSFVGSKLRAKFYKTIVLPKFMFSFNYNYKYKIRKLNKHDLILTREVLVKTVYIFK
jgi:hypothetical protein